MKNLKKLLKKIIFKKKKKTCVVSKKETLKKIYKPEISINIGDVVKLSNYAKKKYIRGKNIYGCCSPTKICTCEKMFESEIMGLVTEIDMSMAEVVWSNGISGSIFIDNIVTVIKIEEEEENI